MDSMYYMQRKRNMVYPFDYHRARPSHWREEKIDWVRVERFYAEFKCQQNAREPY
jgi:hypothetical protein